ncbi:signal peptide-containing protein [Theileria equi strain WA]|uniref:Signal peptide-containing protein n=1 Tax=Theileria equi strain WA TaxID=1537102 RepID=L0AW34_THEEQ|nr:signal peptide-containing protein [Theileria equi strain WA]AFZ79760.1 signal peptide-containing protein [Theileria equi strain WA]|eukprot:XP_004829426.1 signal peptide-containing protein [Theileria equi strain WA]
MRFFSVLSTALLVGFCYCVPPNYDYKDQGGVAGPKIVKLNVNDIDTNLFSTEESFPEGVPLKTVTPKDGVLISSVMDGKMEVYTVPRDQVCYLCELHSEDGYKLLRIHSHKDYKIEFHYFENEGSGWSTLKKYEFEERLEKMQ